MSRTFYPSDEYDSEDLERSLVRRRLRQWFGKRWSKDADDDDPPLSPVTGRMPKPTPPLAEAAAAA